VCIKALKGEGKPRSKKQIDEKARDGERGRCVCVDRKQKDVRVKLLGVVFARTYRVCVGLFVYGSDFAGREAG